MPFWERSKRCENCRYWQRTDPAVTEAECHAPKPLRLPFWQALLPARKTNAHDGKDCEAYSHLRDSKRPHPLDNAGVIVMRAQVGDRIPMRTYSAGAVSYTEARVIRHTQKYCVVEMHNRAHRIRYNPSAEHRAGTVVGLERWGVDTAGKVVRVTVKREDMSRAVGMLANVKVGDSIKLLGYPPFDGHTKVARVYAVEKTRIRINMGRGYAWMHRTGPHAGLIEKNLLWVLDTTEETNDDANNP